MLQYLHSAIVAIQGYMVAAMKILTGADFVGLHAKIEAMDRKVDAILGLHTADPATAAILEIKPAPQGAELPKFLQPEATGIGSLTASGQNGTLQNAGDDGSATTTGEGHGEMTAEAPRATSDGATTVAEGAQSDPSQPGQQAA